MAHPALLFGGLGLAALLLSRKRDDDAAPALPDADEVKEEVNRIVRESAEIVQGKRDSYSDQPDVPVSPREAAERTKDALDKVKQATSQTTHAAEDALAIEAARSAAESEAKAEVDRPTPAPKPVVVKPVPKPTPKPAPKPIVVKPAPKPVVTSSTASGPPPGFDAVKAKNAAPGLAKHIKNKQYNYTKSALQAWQLVAGIAQDGVYGPASYNALKFYVGAAAPKKLFAKAKDGTPYPNTPYPPPEWKS